MEYVNAILEQLTPAQIEYLNTRFYSTYRDKVNE